MTVTQPVQGGESAVLIDDDTSGGGKFLTFAIGDESYALSILVVREIIGMQTVTIVPDVPRHVRGVINLRGKVIPVMDVRVWFGLPDREYDDRTCIVVIERDYRWMGLIVDTVSEVLDIPEGCISEPPQVGTSDDHFIAGVGEVEGRLRLILDSTRLV